MKAPIWLFLLMLLMAASGHALAQREVIQSKIEQRKFIFEAQSASPMKGGSQSLSAGYTLELRGDSLVCHLPYYGRLYQAPMGSADEGMKFASSKFGYEMKDKKKGGWDIRIRTQDTKNRPQIFITVFENGNASVKINSNDRQPISYMGFIKME